MKMVSSETPNATIEYSAKFSIFTSMGQGSRSLLVSQIYLFNCYQLIVLLSSLETSVTKYAPPPHKISIFSQAYFLLRGPPTRLSLFAGVRFSTNGVSLHRSSTILNFCLIWKLRLPHFVDKSFHNIKWASASTLRLLTAISTNKRRRTSRAHVQKRKKTR